MAVEANLGEWDLLNSWEGMKNHQMLVPELEDFEVQQMLEMLQCGGIRVETGHTFWF